MEKNELEGSIAGLQETGLNFWIMIDFLSFNQKQKPVQHRKAFVVPVQSTLAFCYSEQKTMCLI